MSEGAVSDQDRMFTLVSKLPEMTWSKLKETTEMRKRLVGYESLKEAVRTLVSEQNILDAMGRSREPARLLPLTDVVPIDVEKKPRKKWEDKSAGIVVKTKVSCHYCGKIGHYQADCWKKFPEKFPDKFKRAGEGKGKG